MSTTAQSTPSLTLDTATPLDAFPGLIAACHEATAGTVALATVSLVAEAVRDTRQQRVVVKYVDDKAEVDARVLWPNALTVTKEKHLVARCYCTLRREVRSFRLDRMIAVHPLSTPDDAEPQTAPPTPDPARIAVRIGQALVTLTHNATLDAADTALLDGAVEDTRRLYRAVTAA